MESYRPFLKIHYWGSIIFILGSSATLFVQSFLKYTKMYIASVILGRLMYPELKEE